MVTPRKRTASAPTCCARASFVAGLSGNGRSLVHPAYRGLDSNLACEATIRV